MSELVEVCPTDLAFIHLPPPNGDSKANPREALVQLAAKGEAPLVVTKHKGGLVALLPRTAADAVVGPGGVKERRLALLLPAKAPLVMLCSTLAAAGIEGLVASLPHCSQRTILIPPKDLPKSLQLLAAIGFPSSPTGVKILNQAALLTGTLMGGSWGGLGVVMGRGESSSSSPGVWSCRRSTASTSAPYVVHFKSACGLYVDIRMPTSPDDIFPWSSVEAGSKGDEPFNGSADDAGWVRLQAGGEAGASGSAAVLELVSSNSEIPQTGIWIVAGGLFARAVGCSVQGFPTASAAQALKAEQLERSGITGLEPERAGDVVLGHVESPGKFRMIRRSWDASAEGKVFLDAAAGGSAVEVRRSEGLVVHRLANGAEEKWCIVEMWGGDPFTPPGMEVAAEPIVLPLKVNGDSSHEAEKPAKSAEEEPAKKASSSSEDDESDSSKAAAKARKSSSESSSRSASRSKAKRRSRDRKGKKEAKSDSSDESERSRSRSEKKKEERDRDRDRKEKDRGRSDDRKRDRDRDRSRSRDREKDRDRDRRSRDRDRDHSREREKEKQRARERERERSRERRRISRSRSSVRRSPVNVSKRPTRGFDQREPPESALALPGMSSLNLGLGAALAALPPGSAPQAGTVADPEVEAFLAVNPVDQGTAFRFRALPLSLQRLVMMRGSLVGTRDPSAVLMSRVRDAIQSGGSNSGMGAQPLPPPTAASSPEVEAFLAANPVDFQAASRLRALPTHLQRLVLIRGSLSGVRDASSVLMSRVRDALSGGLGSSSTPSSAGQPPTFRPGERPPGELVRGAGILIA